MHYKVVADPKPPRRSQVSTTIGRMKAVILFVVFVLGATNAKPPSGMGRKDLELLEACAEYDKRGTGDGYLKELCEQLAKEFQGVFGVTDDYKRGVTDDYKRGATDDYKRGVTDDYKRGATDDYKRGATDDYKRGATDDYKRGATDDYKRGATDDYKRGATDDYKRGATDDYERGVTDDYKRGVTDDKRSYTYGVTDVPNFTDVPDWFWEWLQTHLLEDFDKKTLSRQSRKE